MIKTPEQILREGVNSYINPDFKWLEFITPINGKPNIEILKNIKNVADILSIYKHKLFNGNPVTITSGYRSPKHQIEIYKQKGITDPGKIPMGSYHLKGLAADFTVKDFSIGQLYRLMDIHHFGGVEDTQGNWQHIDLRGYNCRFRANNKILVPHYNTISHDKIFRK